MSARTDRSGLIAGLGCYTLWGLLPLLFHAAQHAGAGAFEIVAWRTLWSVPAAGALVLATKQGRAFAALFRQPRVLGALLLSACLIGLNWTLYVWAVNSGQVLAGSLGYYINPIMNMAAGALLFRERIDRSGYLAIALAAVGVLLQGLALGTFPWISVVLALSFCTYGILRKQVRADPQTGLLFECVVLSLPALAYVAWITQAGQSAFGRTAAVTGWLVLTGPVTVVPLYCFAFAARRLPLTVMGFLQFISPTLQFIIGVEGGEPLGDLRLVSFAFIWGGVLVFAAGAIRRGRRLRAAALTPVEA